MVLEKAMFSHGTVTFNTHKCIVKTNCLISKFMLTRLKTTRSNSDDNKETPQKAERNDHRSVTRTNEGKKTNSRKQPHNDSTNKKVQPPEQRTGRTASEGASEKKIPHKHAQSKGSSTSKGISDFQRSVSVSATVGTKPKENKRLPAVPTGSKTNERSSKEEGKAKHNYDDVKGTEDKGHKYANVELSEEATRSESILEPKYDAVDTESTKKNQKESGKGKAKDGDHYYHTLEESERVDAEATNDEEYSSPKSKSLVMSKVAVQDKKGTVLSTEENATVKEAGGTKSQRAKSCSGKKPSKDKAARDHEYEEPTHNTLPHRSTPAVKAEDKKKSMIQAGKLTSVFDDPMYSASVEISTPKLIPVKVSSPKHVSSEAPVLRNP